MQMAHVYVQSISKESRRSEKVSVPNSPTRSARLCLSQSNGLESHTNMVSVHIHMHRTMRKLKSICEHISNAELAHQECSIGISRMGGAKKAQGPNGCVRHTCRTSRTTREGLQISNQNMSGHSKMAVQNQTHLVQAQNAPRGATEARGPCECIRNGHGHAQLPI